MSEILHSMAQWNWFGIAFVVLVVPASCLALHGLRMWSERPTKAERAARLPQFRHDYRYRNSITGLETPATPQPALVVVSAPPRKNVVAAHRDGLLEFRAPVPLEEILVRKAPRRQG